MGRGGEGSPGAPPHPPTGSPHSGHCLLTRQSLQTEEKNDIICHPSVDGGGQTGRKSGRLPPLSSLTIILSTSNPSDLAIVMKIRGSQAKGSHVNTASWHICPGAVTFRLTECPLVPLSPKRCITHHKDMHFAQA